MMLLAWVCLVSGIIALLLTADKKLLHAWPTVISSLVFISTAMALALKVVTS